MKKYRIAFFITALLLSGCATNQVTYEPVGSKDIDICGEAINCIVDTDVGEALLSIGEISAMTLSPVNMAETQGENTKNSYYDYLVTVTNTTDGKIYFDPEKIAGYDPDAILTELKSNKNEALGWTAGVLVFGALMGGTEGVTQVLADPGFTQLLFAADLSQQSINEAENKFSNEKISAQFISPGEIAGGRIILDSEHVAKNSFETEQGIVTILAPISTDSHRFEFHKVAVGTQ